MAVSIISFAASRWIRIDIRSISFVSVLGEWAIVVPSVCFVPLFWDFFDLCGGDLS